jgi:2-keto-3-deoxy-L-rhamnonate aldolase RhmA
MTGHVRHSLSHTQQRLVGDGPWIGLVLVTENSMIAEACWLLNLDWVLIDMEASPMSKGDALKMLKAMSASSLNAVDPRACDRPSSH